MVDEDATYDLAPDEDGVKDGVGGAALGTSFMFLVVFLVFESDGYEVGFGFEGWV